jgi:hypothetical protein
MREINSYTYLKVETDFFKIRKSAIGLFHMGQMLLLYFSTCMTSQPIPLNYPQFYKSVNKMVEKYAYIFM